MKTATIAACAALASVPAWAQGPADFSVVDAKLQACLARHGDTPGVDNCYGVAKAAANRRLNDVYAGLVNALKHPGDPIEARDDPEILRRWSPLSARGSPSGMRSAATTAAICFTGPGKTAPTLPASTRKPRRGWRR